MTAPDWWELVLLGLGGYRLTRLLAWDAFPPVARLRERLLGLRRDLPPSAAMADMYRRPLLAELVACPFCLGAWVSLALWGAWLLEPAGTLIAMTPLALSAVIGLVARNLDP
ncbi:MAG: DUF1360 domain-containing protein [Armatimonadota bacterium]|nr:DUF1360 domain-containing protein [Armatimonadota bacterium]